MAHCGQPSKALLEHVVRNNVQDFATSGACTSQRDQQIVYEAYLQVRRTSGIQASTKWRLLGADTEALIDCINATHNHSDVAGGETQPHQCRGTKQPADSRKGPLCDF